MSLVVDTNVLLLLVGGMCLGDRLSTLKCLKAESIETFKQLLACLRELDAFPLIVPPHVLAETSNLVVQGANGERAENLLQTLSDLAAGFDERFVPATVAATRPEFLRLGLTDAVLLCLAESGCQLLTKDGALFRAAVEAHYPATNFNHLIGNY